MAACAYDAQSLQVAQGFAVAGFALGASLGGGAGCKAARMFGLVGFGGDGRQPRAALRGNVNFQGASQVLAC